MEADTAVVDDSNAQQRIAELTARLEEAEETLRAVSAGEIDAFIVQGPRGEQVYSLRSAEQPYVLSSKKCRKEPPFSRPPATLCIATASSQRSEDALEEVIGTALDRFLSGSDRMRSRCSGGGLRQMQARLTAVDGRVIDVYLSLSASKADDDTERLNLIVTDLSALLDAQSGRDRAEQQSQAKDEFMAMLAHELRNPLSAISAAVQVLEASDGRDAPALRARSIIGRQVHHLARLVDDLLDVGRVVTGRSRSNGAPLICDLVHRAVPCVANAETISGGDQYPTRVDRRRSRSNEQIVNTLSETL